MKRAIVLSGGGSKGSYEVGFMQALKELHISYDIITGTSIGALNGALIAQGDFKAMEDLWKILDINHVFNGVPDLAFIKDDFMNQSNMALSFFKKYLLNKGADVTPFYDICKNLLDTKKLLSSPIDFGLCTVKYPLLKPLFITKSEMETEHIYDYLMASAACFPVFPIIDINGESYVDGGYYDNLPIDLALDMGADEIIAVDLHMDAVHPAYLSRPHIIYTSPYVDLGTFMDFTPEVLERNRQIGYLTAMKYFGKYEGKVYTFKKHTDPLFEKYYRTILFLEKNMRSLVNGNANDATLTLMNGNHGLPLDVKDYTYVTMDFIGDLLGFDDLNVYAFNDFIKKAKKEFVAFVSPDYLPEKMKKTELAKRLAKLNRKTIVGFILHQLLYPENEVFDIKTYATFFMKELLMAELLYLVYQQD